MVHTAAERMTTALFIATVLNHVTTTLRHGIRTSATIRTTAIGRRGEDITATVITTQSHITARSIRTGNPWPAS